MKRLSILFILVMFLTTACGNNLYFNNKVYKQYGLFNESQSKDEAMEYDVIWGNVFWSVFFCQTIIVPVYFLGFELMEPVGVKVGTKIKENGG